MSIIRLKGATEIGLEAHHLGARRPVDTMTTVTLGHAGCDDEVIHKLTMAASLFRGRGIDVRVMPWEDSDEDLVVTGVLDPYGREVGDIARRRLIPQLTVHRCPPGVENGECWILRERPAFDYFRILEKVLSSAARAGRWPEEPPPVRIETLPRIGCGLLTFRRARVLVDAAQGVCRAASEWDIAVLAEALRDDRPVRCLPAQGLVVSRHVATSLESFVFTALVDRPSCEWRGAPMLSLRAWPDIRHHRYGGELARLSASLLGRERSVEELADLAPARIVAAFLHACAIAGLLHEKTEVAGKTTKAIVRNGTRNTAVAFRHWLGLGGQGPGGRNKLLFIGPTGAGKTTAIRSISGGSPVLTEERVPMGQVGKSSGTTVEMEYQYLKIGGDILHLYGLCGRHDLTGIQGIPVSGALGLVLLLDASNDGIYRDAEAWLGGIRGRHPDVPVAVGVTKTDRSPGFSLSRLRNLLGAVPALSVDARDADNLRQLLRLLMMQSA